MTNTAALAQAGGDAGALLAAIARGSEAALTEFYRGHQARIYGFALRRVQNAADAAEILNEVMLEVWRSAARFEGRSSALTWVLGIAHHKTMDRLRRRAGALPLDDDAAEFIEDDAPGPAEAIEGMQDAARLRECLARLPDAQRAVVQLAFFEDLPYGEIAAILDCPEGTVKTRMFHAKQQLKHCLARGGMKRSGRGD